MVYLITSGSFLASCVPAYLADTSDLGNLLVNESTSLKIATLIAAYAHLETLLQMTSTIKPRLKGSWVYPSSWPSLRLSRTLNHEGASLALGMNPISAEFDKEESEAAASSSGFLQALVRTATTTSALETPQKVRSRLIGGSFCKCLVLIIVASIYSDHGRVAVAAPTYVSRASHAVLSNIEFSRTITSRWSLASQFNSLISAVPEIAVLNYLSTGAYTPGLLTLPIDQGTRSIVESSIRVGLGQGSHFSEMISRDTAQHPISTLATGRPQAVTSMLKVDSSLSEPENPLLRTLLRGVCCRTTPQACTPK